MDLATSELAGGASVAFTEVLANSRESVGRSGAMYLASEPNSAGRVDNRAESFAAQAAMPAAPTPAPPPTTPAPPPTTPAPPPTTPAQPPTTPAPPPTTPAPPPTDLKRLEQRLQRMRHPMTEQQLRTLGFTELELRSAVDNGLLIAFHPGWLARDLKHPAIPAIQRGVRVGCLTACAIFGLWVPPEALQLPHWSYQRHPKISGESVHLHYARKLPNTAVPPLRHALRQVLHHHDLESSLIVLESAIRKQLITRFEAEELLRDAPKRISRSAHLLDPSSQSGSETRVRLFFARRGTRIRPQHPIDRVGTVDLLIGESLIIEVDSTAYHSESLNVNKDRARDLAAYTAGYRVVRLSYQQVWYDWQNTLQRLSAILRTRRHRRAPRPLALVS